MDIVDTEGRLAGFDAVETEGRLSGFGLILLGAYLAFAIVVTALGLGV